MTSRPWIKDRNTELVVAIAAYLAGSFLLYDAYERRGKPRPFWHRFLSGGV